MRERKVLHLADLNLLNDVELERRLSKIAEAYDLFITMWKAKPPVKPKRKSEDPDQGSFDF